MTQLLDRHTAIDSFFNPKISFVFPLTTYKETQITGPVQLTPNTKGAISGHKSIVRLIADGVNVPTFDGFSQVVFSSSYDNTSGAANTINFHYDGKTFWYQITKEAVPPLDRFTVLDTVNNGFVWDWARLGSIAISPIRSTLINVKNNAPGQKRLLKVTQGSAGNAGLSIVGCSVEPPDLAPNATTYYWVVTDSKGQLSTKKFFYEKEDDSPLWSPAYGSASQWLNPDDVAVSASLAEWRDRLSGQVYKQADVARQPSVIASEINGRKAVKFVDDGFEVDNTKPIKCAMFAVSKLAELLNNRLLGSAEADPVNFVNLRVVTNDTNDIGIGGLSGTSNWGGVRVNGGPMTIGGGINLPGFQFTTTDTYVVYITFRDKFNLKTLAKSGTIWGSFSLGDFIVWEEQPEPLELDRTRAWLAQKWGVTLPTTDPFGQVAPTLELVPNYPRIKTSADLISAVSTSVVGQTLYLDKGVFAIAAPLLLKPFTSLVGSGEESIIEGDPAWSPGFADVEVGGTESFDAYLIKEDTVNISGTNYVGSVSILDVTMQGPLLHGAVRPSAFAKNLWVKRCKISDFGWSGIRGRTKTFRIEHCTFINAGNTWRASGGAIYGDFSEDGLISDCSFIKTPDRIGKHYGYKSDGVSNVTIRRCEFLLDSFAVEAAHQNTDTGNVVENCIMDGAISVPKETGGGNVFATAGTRLADGSMTFDGVLSWNIRDCYMTTSYCIEGHRNSMEISRCVQVDERPNTTGNFFSEFSSTPGNGPVWIHDNWVRAIRGLYWSNAGSNNLFIENNYVVSTPRSNDEGFIGPGSVSGLASVFVRNNIFDATVTFKPLYRSPEARAGINTENNILIGVADTQDYVNARTLAPTGPASKPVFKAGVAGRYQVDGWSLVFIGE